MHSRMARATVDAAFPFPNKECVESGNSVSKRRAARIQTRSCSIFQYKLDRVRDRWTLPWRELDDLKAGPPVTAHSLSQ